MSTSTSTDVERTGFLTDPNNPFSDKTVRSGFIQKVYGILAFMLAITFGFAGVCRFTPSIDLWFQENAWIFWIAMVFYLIAVIPLSCCPMSVGRSFPCNYILLAILTISMSFMMTFFLICYKIESILISLGATFIVVLSVSLFSCLTSFDFTKLIGIMSMVLMAFIAFSIIAAIVYYVVGEIRILELIIACIGVVIFTIYLAIDTQMIIGGRRFEFSPEDYVIGALCLYIDIIQIFLYILQILNNRR